MSHLTAMPSQPISSDDLFTQLFDTPDRSDTCGSALTLVQGSATQLAVVPAWTSRLDALRGDELTAALKRMGTKQLQVEARNRLPLGVDHGANRQQLMISVAMAIEPQRERKLDEPGELRKLVNGVNNALIVQADPTGVKREAAKLARQAQFSLAGQVGAQDTKVRRAAAAQELGTSVPSKYTDDEVRTIRWMCLHGWNDIDTAAHFNNRTKPAMIWAIRKGVSYKSVSGVAETGPAAPAPVVKTTKPSVHNRR